ncbi:hypothetical protein JKP88DRAFT_228612 [Tribonema minus]|uniref:Uncharacterized protein n=1 Tax=Tribonema minus TaxID=303371 RepID=A0A835YI93_9STRA|nr:hypothetical protein JKP88DRAFT_228612 [Tribonema minus]
MRMSKTNSMERVWVGAIATHLGLVFALFISVAIMTVRVNTATDPTAPVVAADDLTYTDKLSCSCDGGAPNAAAAPGSYDFTCTAGYLGTDACLLDSNCGFCGGQFYGAFASALAFACAALAAAVAMCVAFHRVKESHQRPTQKKAYCTYVTVHGARDYGYPLNVCLDLEQALQLQSKIWAIVKSDPKHLVKTSEQLKSSNVTVWTSLGFGGLFSGAFDYFAAWIMD